MKVGEFSKALSAYADLVDAQSTSAIGGSVRKLVAAWSGKEALAMKTLIGGSKIAGDIETAPSNSKTSVGDLRDALEGLRKFATLISKKAFLDDLHLLIEHLDAHEQADIEAFARAWQHDLDPAVQPQPDDLIDDYVSRLKASYKDEKLFAAVYGELERDRRLKAPHLAEIATRFSAKTAKSSPRRVSLENIRFPHETYATSKAKSRFFGGRSAA